MGTTDKEKKFHSFGIAICESERSDDYAFLKEGVERFNEHCYKPEYLIADCAQAIENGFRKVFQYDFRRVHCFFHVRKSMSELSIMLNH